MIGEDSEKVFFRNVRSIPVFLFLFGIVYEPAESILEYMMLTGTMMLGAGIIMIGGLYFKAGSTAGAYTAIISCLVIPVAQLIIKRTVELPYERFPFRSQDFGLASILLAVLLYIGVSLLIPDRKANRTE